MPPPEREQRPLAGACVPDPPPAGGVYWMDASRRRQALEWLRSAELTPEERAVLREFAGRWRTAAGIGAAERRRLRLAFERVERRLRRSASPRPAR